FASGRRLRSQGPASRRSAHDTPTTHTQNRKKTTMRTTKETPGTHPSTDLHVEACGEGTTVVLAHGSLATAADEWAAQRPLADEGYRLLAPDRRGYGRSPAAEGED